MADTIAESASLMATAFGQVAIGAVPIGLGLWYYSRKEAMPLLPAWKPRSTQWNGMDAILLFGVCLVMQSLGGFVSLAMVPLLAVLFYRWSTILGMESPSPIRSTRVLADIADGILTWLWLTPVVFAVYFLSNYVLIQLGGTPGEHPLAKESPLQLIIAGCIVAPFFEEMMFRRVLVPWAMARHYRPWLILLAGAIGVASLNQDQFAAYKPLILLAVLALGLLGIQALRRVIRRFPVRTISAIWATAVLFGVMHPVWPTPIPLFTLALGLGWLMARHRSVVAPMIVHSLFNLVSAVHVLQGGK